MYRYFSVIFTMFVCIFICYVAAFANEMDFPSEGIGAIEVSFFVGERYFTWNENKIKMSVAPFIQNNRTYIPVRYLANSLGVEDKDIYWDKNSKQVTLVLSAEKSDIGTREVAILTVGKYEIFSTRHGVKSIDVAPIIRDGRTFLPARFVAEAFGYNASWDKEKKIVRVDKKELFKNTELAVEENLYKHVLITTDFVNVRKGPGLNYTVIGQVNSGERYLWLDSTDKWYKLLLRENIEGWVFNELAEVVTVRKDERIVVASCGKDISRELETDKKLENEVDWISDGELEDINSTLKKDEKNDKNDEELEKSIEEDAVLNYEDSKDVQVYKLKDITVSTDEEKVILTIMADVELDYNVFMLQDPLRLVVDFNDVNTGDLKSSVDIDSNLVLRYRLAEFSSEPLVTRLVLDLKEPIDYNIISKDNKLLIRLTSKWPVRGKTVFIDPGHGGEDPGATYYNIKEKDIVMDISNRMYDILRQQGAVVEMSRYGDVYVGLYERPEMANEIGADIFISIHANAHWRPNISGIMTFHRKEPLYGSIKLAEMIQKELVNELQLEDRGVRKADFVVIRETNMPAVLVEVAFLSNQKEAMLLSQSSFRQRVAEAIVRGINNYFKYFKDD
ncbi:N-acetylmuramoyl-L-alanine amidase [Peptococcaceae bacterium]|nr:N-acetylmuramoyl-L-alanine amidase [Peptococcaceae bacterium]